MMILLLLFLQKQSLVTAVASAPPLTADPVVIAQVKIRAHPCESNMFHDCCKMDWIVFVPPWCPKQASELQLHTSEDFEHVSFGKVREVGVLSCNVLQCRVVWTMCRRANSA
jgi:hypothetical protein